MKFHRIYGEVTLRVGRRETGLRALRRAADNGDGTAARILSAELQDEGKPDAAIDVLKSSAAAGARGVALALADLLSESEVQGAEEDAEFWYRKAVEEKIPGALNNLGCFLSMDDNRTVEAKLLLLQALETGDEFASGNIGKIYLDESNYEEALPWLQRSLVSGNEEILPYLARAEIEMGDQAAAWEHILTSMRTDNLEAFLAAALYLDKYGDQHPDRSVEKMFEKSLDSGAEAHFLFANWLKERGRPDEAEREYRLAIQEGEVNGYLNLANMLESLGREEEAESELRNGVEAGDPWAAGGLVNLLADQSRYEEIPDLIGRAEELGIPQQEASDMWILYRLR
jgi:Tfp pilus assembly protein PilF